MADRPFDVVTFDCYGTLIDWEGGIGRAFEAEAVKIGHPVDVATAVRLYGEVEAVVEREAYLRYRDILAETARRVAARMGWPLPPERAGFLAESLPAWPQFPDVNAALRRLVAAGYRLGILSNVDDDLLVWSRRHLSATFEIVVTAQQVRSYKPATPHFLAARALVGGAAWLHAAQSHYHDVTPCEALGIPAAWINRKSGAPSSPARPMKEFPTLKELADWLAP
jgi:2-haloacid dehalogenase/putative hydrolase of the HAD superfamily